MCEKKLIEALIENNMKTQILNTMKYLILWKCLRRYEQQDGSTGGESWTTRGKGSVF